jgi:hypothetical protein
MRRYWPVSGAGIARDLQRVVSVPSPWLLAAIGVFLSASTTAGLIGLRSAPSGPAALAALPALAGTMGAVAVGADFRYGSLPAELLLVGGKTAYCVRTGLAVAQIGAGLASLMAVASVALSHAMGHPAFAWGQTAEFVAVSAAAGACWGVIGTSLALYTRGQLAAVVSLLIYLLMLEPMLGAALHAVSAVLPSPETMAALAIPAPGHLVTDELRLALTAAVVYCGSILVFHRKEIPVTGT